MSRVLVDTSIWIDHLRQTNPELVALLDPALVLGHPYVRAEVALGSISDRWQVLGLLGWLPQATVATADEVVNLIERHSLHGRGLGYVDAQLLAATLITPGARLWSRDRRLAAAARDLDIAHAEAG
ncbi:MAG TPA: hypothetical protein VGJ14_17525 [Sporichthyaceae bacterium]